MVPTVNDPDTRAEALPSQHYADDKVTTSDEIKICLLAFVVEACEWKHGEGGIMSMSLDDVRDCVPWKHTVVKRPAGDEFNAAAARAQSKK